GNGRWAKARQRPRSFGHNAGRKAVRAVVEACLREGVQVLTLFAFSSENWQRPQDEVGALMGLFLRALDKEVDELHGHGVRLRFIGDLGAFDEPLRQRMHSAMAQTAGNEARLGQWLSLAELPPPDLFIRTGGERRISNFLLWQVAYAELYFTDTLWPDFDQACLREAIEDYANRERRYGRTSEQVATVT